MKKTLFALLIFLSLSIACKKSVESEKNKWEANKQLIQQLAVEYPTFKTVLTTIENNATQAMQSAEKMSDEKQKIEAMAKANAMATPQFVSDLEKFDATIAKLKELSASAIQNAHDDNDAEAAQKASTDAETAIYDAKELIANANVTTEAEAGIIITKAISQLTSVTGILENIMNVASGKKSDEEKAKTEQEDKEKAEKEALADVKCEYCATMNKHDAAKCASCGAPIEKK